MVLIIGGAFQGKKRFALDELKVSESQILDHFDRMIEGWIREGKDACEEAERILASDIPVIISTEKGMGIVPLDKEVRYIREMTGRILCNAAKKADSVYRVTAGIGQKIK